MRLLGFVSLVAVSVILASCGRASEPVALRIVDLFDASMVEGSVEVEVVEPTEWRFDGEGTVALSEATEDEDNHAETFGWEAYRDIEGFEVLRSLRIVRTRYTPTTSARWLTFTWRAMRITERSENSDSLTSSVSGPPKL